MSMSQRIYDAAPIWAQNLACSAVGWRTLRKRYGPGFRRQLQWLNESQWWTLEKLLAYQDEQLRQLIAHAYETVPYYREVMRGRQLKPQDIQSVADLPRLPLLTKDLVREAGDQIISRSVDMKQAVHCHTSGTTGAGLQFHMSAAAYEMQWAVWWRHRGRFGFTLGQPHANFSGQSVVPLNQSRPPFWRENRPLRQTYVSLYHMTPANMPAYVEMLEQRRFAYFVGYPSAIYLIADYLRSISRRLAHPPKWIITGAESLLPFQAEAMREWIGAPVTDQYGQAEGCANMSRCEQHRFHVDMEFAVIEPIEVGQAPDGRICRVVGTALHNMAMPFIRYDTGDLATFSDEPCACGRHSPAASYVDGRVEGYIVTPDGRRVGRIDHCFKDMVHVAESQVIQERAERIRILVVRRPQYTERDEATLTHELRARLGERIGINFEYVEKIPRTASGKFRAVISKLNAADAPDATRKHDSQAGVAAAPRTSTDEKH